MTNCSACTKPITTPWEVAATLCTDCAHQFGVMPMLPARRPARPCDRCNGMQFIRAIPRELSASGLDYVQEIASPMPVTYQHFVKNSRDGKEAYPLNARAAFGFLEMYICRKCGFVEWYCFDPDTIPIGPAYMTEAIDHEPEGEPYR